MCEALPNPDAGISTPSTGEGMAARLLQDNGRPRMMPAPRSRAFELVRRQGATPADDGRDLPNAPHGAKPMVHAAPNGRRPDLRPRSRQSVRMPTGLDPKEVTPPRFCATTWASWFLTPRQEGIFAGGCSNLRRLAKGGYGASAIAKLGAGGMISASRLRPQGGWDFHGMLARVPRPDRSRQTASRQGWRVNQVGHRKDRATHEPAAPFHYFGISTIREYREYNHSVFPPSVFHGP